MEHTIKKILVPVDFNEPSVRAVNYAGGLARKVNAEMPLLILSKNHRCGNPEDELGTTVYHITLKSVAK
jgi:hypothetical protein